jgi:spermidine synthase
MPFSIIAKVVHRALSPISGEIIVKEQLGKYTFYVDNIPQSGGVVKEIWKKGVKALPDFKPVPYVLLLGLGGGSAVHLLKKRWEKVKIVGVEIDPQVVVVGRTYFDLDKVSGLRMVTADAFDAIREKKYQVDDKKYDLILVDLYLGSKLPGFVKKEDFIKKLKKLLTKRGIVVFNFLLDKEGKQQVQSYEEKVKKNFARIKTLETGSNELIFGYQKP